MDLGELEQWPTVRLGEEFRNGLVEALPGLGEHGCSYSEPGGFLRRLNEDEGTWLGHVLEHVAIELQNIAGAHVTFGKTRSNGTPGQYDVVYEYESRDVGLEAGRLALALLESLLPPELRSRDTEGFDLEEARDDFIRFAQRRALGPSTASLVRAAMERDIPFLRLNRYSLVQFGHGSKQRRIQATVTSETRHIAVEIASDKEETNTILGDLGLPVPQQEIVHSAKTAILRAERIGYPVVLKPLDGNHGRGVSIGIEDRAGIEHAFEQARKHSRAVLVESYVRGFDHRLLVVNGELVAAAKRVPGHVIGDGVHTIEELVEITNNDPRRGIGHEKVLTKLEFDHQAERLMAQRGIDATTVLEQGDVFYMRSTANLSTGGTAIDVTDIIHPDNSEMAVRAAQAVGLDVAGIDFLCTDISESYVTTRGAICEVNAAPGFRMHVAPTEGEPRDVSGKVMDMLFPPGSPSRIPIAAVTGTNGKTTTARMLAHIFKMSGQTVGLTTTDGVYIDGKRTVEGDMTGPVAARMVLRDPKVDVAVLETARGGLLRSGMGYRSCTVACALNVQADHLGLRGIGSLDELAEVKRIPIEVAKDTAVLNADDERCLRMADYTQAEHVCYVTMNPHHPLVQEHVRSGGRAVVLEEGAGGQMITIYDHGSHIPLLWTHLIPATLGGRATHNVQNAMFAAAMAFSMEVQLEGIRHGLRTFDTTFFQAPGRMNIYDGHPFKVILDYGHNPAAVAAMCALVVKLEPKGRRIVVLSAPGDRRDEDICEVAEICAGNFDHYICRRDDSPRGRESDEVPRMLRDTLLAHDVKPECIDVVPHEVEAIETALKMADKDDLLLVFCDQIARSWTQITGFNGGGPAEIGTSEPGPAVTITPSAESADFSLEGQMLVRDDRGVRLARELED